VISQLKRCTFLILLVCQGYQFYKLETSKSL
jgi:hypothetical protein